MIHPSYVDLMNVVNKGVEEGETPVINSRYSIVMATAKRARQIVDGDEPMIEGAEGMKPLSIAVKELEQGKLQIIPQDEDTIEEMENEDLRAAKAMEQELTDADLALDTDEDAKEAPDAEAQEEGSDYSNGDEE
ncbi:MAG: DNA-directed RNA polymerase subunit omega [Lachnospiraceae bacterium]